jgi:hypothetical protein
MRSALKLVMVISALITGNIINAQNIQYSRYNDQRGLYTFETGKEDMVGYDGFKLQIGGAFTQGFQALSHTNADTSKLYQLGNGFNLAAANLNFNVQLGDGIRMFLENYMASRHHNEFWVKGGYIQIDKLPMFGNPEWYTKYFTTKIGHMEVNYGDTHFRRSDGGNTIFNPFVENTLIDQFATEIGGEIYAYPVKGLMLMAGLTNGLINGNVRNYETNPDKGVTKKNPAIILKAAYDNTYKDLRYRLSASMYSNSETPGTTIFSGDRTGSNYYGVMEAKTFDSKANFRSGRFTPGSFNSVTAIMINPFVKYQGFELFGTYEIINGKLVTETDDRTTTQMAIEGIFRFLKDEQAFIGARYNTVTSRLSGYTQDISVDRLTFGAGWFPTKNLLLKGEYVLQNYNDFNATDIRNEGEFNGVVIQAVVGF